MKCDDTRRVMVSPKEALAQEGAETPQAEPRRLRDWVHSDAGDSIMRDISLPPIAWTQAEESIRARFLVRHLE